MGRGRFSAIAAILLAATVVTGACGGDGGSITLRSEGTGQEGSGQDGSGGGPSSTDPSSTDPSSDDPAPADPSGDPGAPPAADPSGANAALPEGSDLTFTARETALDEDGEQRVSVPVPEGWGSEDFMGVEFGPPEGSGLGFSTSITVSDGCDGLCQATDWEQRLRGPDGMIGMLLAQEGSTELPLEGGVTGTQIRSDDPFGSSIVVLRWSDSADTYFKCEAEVDEDHPELLEALTAACVAAQTNWLP